ncbi:MAG: hypothetical protein QXL15_05145 [Candidatus Korarchaeota archaeon]
MPAKGIFMIAWDPKTGPYIRMAYPQDLGIEQDQELVIKVYGGCVIVERAEGYHEIVHEKKEIAAYYSGIELNFILGVLVEGEPASVYRESVITVAPVIFKKKGLLSDTEWDEIFRIVKSFPKMSSDEKIAYALTDPTKKEILENVVKRPGINIQDLRLALRKIDKNITRAEILGHVDLLERLGILAKYWVEGDAEPHLTVAWDVLFSRKTPRGFKELLVKMPELGDAFNEVANRNWQNEQEDLALTVSLTDTQSLISQFKDHPVMKKDELKVPPELTKTYSLLKKLGIIKEIGNLVVLTSIPTAKKLFPKYIIAKILKMIKNGEFPREESIALLKAMRDTYRRTG